MNRLPRRTFMFGALAGLPALAACGNGIGSAGAQRIDARVNATENYLFNTYPNARAIADQSTGRLVMPLITEAGLVAGAGYGRGALRIGASTVDYYSATKGTFGFQMGAKQFAHVLFFMTDDALARFRHASGWVAGADMEYVALDQGGNMRADTTTVNTPVIAMVFGQAGLLAGAKVEGMKYTRIIP